MSAGSPWPFDPTVTWVRHCARCGHIDAREWWPTEDDARAAAGAGDAWRCERCGAADYALKPAAKLGGG